MQILKIKICFLFYVFIYSASLFGQTNNRNPYNIGLRGEYGYILNHSENMEFITNQHFPAYEIYFEKNTFGKKAWQKEYKYPKWGVALYYADFNKILGKGFNLHPYLSFPVIKDKFLDLDFRMGAGLGYMTKKFEPKTNFKDVAIGTHLNLTFSFLLDANFNLTQDLKLHTSIALTHFSNTSFAKPNLGINIPTIGLGISYHFGKELARDTNPTPEFNNKNKVWSFIVRGSVAVNETYTVSNKKYVAGSLSFAAEKQVTPKSKLGLETNIFENPALSAELRSLGDEKVSDFDVLQIGVGGSHTLTIDRFGIYLQAGFYLKSKYKEYGGMYHRVGGIYSFNNGLSTHIILKTHFASAEYLELGIGYRLK